MKIMNLCSFLLGATVLVTACNSKAPATADTTTSTPDTGMVIAGPEIAPADTQQVTQTPAAADKQETTKPSPSKSTSNTTGSNSNSSQSTSGNSNAGSNGDGTASSGSGTTETATEKKGWSKTAKGAVIGGVTGAAAGAVINKKNRGVGAVIGGVTGAAAGAVIGDQMDKKDGRH